MINELKVDTEITNLAGEIRKIFYNFEGLVSFYSSTMKRGDEIGFLSRIAYNMKKKKGKSTDVRCSCMYKNFTLNK